MFEHINHTHNNHSIVCHAMLLGAYFVIVAASTLFLTSSNFNKIAIVGLILCGISLLYIIAVHILILSKYLTLAIYLLLLFFVVLIGAIIWYLGIDTPIIILVFVLIVALAGRLLTACHALFASIIAGLLLVVMQVINFLNWHFGLGSGSKLSFSNALAYCLVFVVLAFVTWLYIRERERSLAGARRTEIVLLEQLEQKAALKRQSKKYVSKLRQLQVEEIKQMYHFTDLGQSGMTLLHDLASHVTALKLETEALKGGSHAKAIIPTRRIIQQLDEVVKSTRDHLHGKCRRQSFNLIGKVSEAITFLQDKATAAHTEIEWQPPNRPWKYIGDAASFCQVITLITNNAIEAYDTSRGSPSYKNRVVVTMERTDDQYIVRISDWGRGIPKSERKRLFQPFRSTKKTGLGLGLYIAKRTIEEQFSGTIELNPRSEHTEFVITLPRAKK